MTTWEEVGFGNPVQEGGISTYHAVAVGTHLVFRSKWAKLCMEKETSACFWEAESSRGSRVFMQGRRQ